jgi:DNA-binding NtrC family response regulator
MELTLDEAIREAVIQALNLCNGNRTHAAKSLAISLRTLRNYIHKFDLADIFKSSETKLKDGSVRKIDNVYDR